MTEHGGRTTQSSDVRDGLDTGTGVCAMVPRIGLTREEAAEAMSVSARTIDTLIADRTSGFPVCRIGTRVVIPVRELSEWLAQQARGA